MKIITNKIECLKCGDVIESANVHDFKWCKCHTVAVDGGRDYLRRVGNFDDYRDLSEYVLEIADLEETKKKGDNKTPGEEISAILGERIGEGVDPLGVPIRIYRAENGFIVIEPDSYGDAQGDDVTVFETGGDQSGIETIADLLWHLKGILSEYLSEPDGKYSRDRIRVGIEMGERYILQKGERVVESSFFRVRRKGEKNEYGERTLTKKEMEGDG